MKIQGDLSTISLSELFKTLSDQRATGILSVYSSMGEKHIALARGEITIFSDRLAERARLGDLLVARGVLTDAKLTEALQAQRASKKRTVLGELLIEKGFVTKKDIDEAMKFQLEEEICDLFTWTDAKFDFDSARTAEEIESEIAHDAAAQANIHRLSIDPQALILEASRRTDDWREFEERLHSPYLCFRISSKGEERFEKAAAVNQRLLRLFREGRTLETVVKQSCLGRFAVYKAAVKFLDDGWILPFPTSEMRFLASEHRNNERYADAMYIYRRLIEVASSDEDREELQKQLDATIEQILRAKEAGRRPEGLEFVSHKGAAASYQRRQRIKNLVLTGALVVSIVLGFCYYLSTLRKDPPPEAYALAASEVERLVAENHFEDAIEIWLKFHNKYMDEQTELGKLSRNRLDGLFKRYAQHVTELCMEAQHLEQAGRFDEARAAYERLLAENPHNRYAETARAALEGLAAKRAARSAEADLAAWNRKLAEAQKLEERKIYEKAREIYLKASEGAPAGSETRRSAEEGLARLRAVESRLRDTYEIALEKIKERKGSDALKTLEEIQNEWRESRWAGKAREQAAVLKGRFERLRSGMISAQRTEDGGAAADALAQYERLLREYAEFEEVKVLEERVQKLGATLQNAEELLQQARAAQAGGQDAKAEELFSRLLRSHRGYLGSKNVTVPLFIKTIPEGATLKLNGEVRGKTPRRTEAPVTGEVVVRVELAGYEAQEQTLVRLEPEHLSLLLRLERAPLRVVQLPGPAYAEPLVLDNVLYAAAGHALAAFDPACERPAWTSPALAERHAAAAAKREIEDGNEHWWMLQAPPAPLKNGDFLMPTPLGKVFEIERSTGKAEQRLALPAHIVGAVCVEKASMLAGKPLMAAACADGQVRVYDLATARLVWEKEIDARSAPEHWPVEGAFPLGSGMALTLSRGGTLRGWEMANGTLHWSFPLDTELESAAFGYSGKTLRQCCLISRKGELIVFDVVRRKVLWRIQADLPSERIRSVTLAGGNIYALTLGGKLVSYPLAEAGAPKPRWTKPLDDTGPAPVASGGMVYAATASGQVLAVTAADGRQIWRFRCASRILRLAEHGPYLYATTEDGKLIVLSKE